MCYILKHLKDKKLRSVHICYTVMTLFSFSNCTEELNCLGSSKHSLRMRMMSYSCYKYEQIMPSYLLSVNRTQVFMEKVLNRQFRNPEQT